MGIEIWFWTLEWRDTPARKTSVPVSYFFKEQDISNNNVYFLGCYWRFEGLNFETFAFKLPPSLLLKLPVDGV